MKANEIVKKLELRKDSARRTAPDCCNVVWHLRYERRIIPGHGDRAIIRNTPPRWHIILLCLITPSVALPDHTGQFSKYPPTKKQSR